MRLRPAHCCLLLTLGLSGCSDSGPKPAFEGELAQPAGVVASQSTRATAPSTGAGRQALPSFAAAMAFTGAAGSLDPDVDAGADAADSGAAPRAHCGDVIAAEHPAFEAIKRLATTRREVRVLVYGQSISMQAWWTRTQRWLKDTYPSGKLVMENHAHGGCSSQCLIGHEPYFLDGAQRNRLPEDVFAWNPDLIIFHVYGDHVDYGYIMRGFAEGCAAFDDYRTWDGKLIPEVQCTPEQRMLSAGYRKPEVLVQGDFVISDKQVSCPATPTTEQFDCFMNNRILPEQVNRYMYRLQDNFHQFPDYIASHHLDPSTLIMRDATHLAEPQGTDVMFSLTVPHLCYEP